MRLPLPISLSLLLVTQKAGAQLAPAADFFNTGAQFYISNNIPAAKERVETGLKIYPDDEKLKKLEELLKQQSQQQQQNQQNQSQQQKSQDQQKQDEAKKDQADQKKEAQQKQAQEQKSANEKKDGEKPEDQKGESQPVAPGQMTPEEAKRLLDAQKGNEQFLQLKPTDKPRDSQRLFKDW